jgi:hypothetical protein
MRRRRIMAATRATRRHGVIPSSGVLNELKGSQAPMYTKQAQLRSKSITEEKTSFSVCVLKFPSQEIAFPIQERGEMSAVHEVLT